MKPTDHSKPIALVTGASSGIGAIYADRLAKRGHDLILVARDVAKLSALAERIRSESGRHVELQPADLTAKDDLRRVEQRLLSDDRIELLVNNAGVGATSALIDSDPDRLEDMIQLNVTALARLTRAVAVGMARRGKGAIINIASIVAVAPELLNGTYGGSKAFVLAFTQSLHHELGPKGIRVQAVLPGATSTDFWNVAGTPVEHLPGEIVMRAEEMVDAALAGFDQGELATIPSLPDLGEWERFDAARKALGPNLSRSHAAQRYQAATAHVLEAA
ncbi:SDR family NAD(P)-dependent oxidoreductase [Variovorax ginsengisoli]|uniref:NADP-dependent 3-hydroxy acid dehydrogenase YdfG n=1 Tax=Variovorax ginsengisoli TaxID=363844 RepID=A0ABT8S5M0_9BURK|nr:SDR family oxidoreductase [Variovorax ginsengisoli]MDN8614414.1 SDR family oxidoreductase [Variovorax ginsengisoli]MDO1533584.1 SDR family oxidoreductase [Variovorax ginsengisoli]